MRYVVTEPVDGGLQWWYVADTQDASMPNFAVAQFWDGVPGAEGAARDFCSKLNYYAQRRLTDEL